MYKAITFLALIAASSAQFLPNGCPSNFSVHLLLPHEDCAKFYCCSNGKKNEMNCAPGTLFDANLQTCVVIAPGGCILGDSTEIYPTTVETTTNDYMSSSTTEGVTPPDRCTEGMWGNIPHEYRCDYFYVCAAGNAIPLHCSDGFEFDPVTRTCVVIATGGCTLGDSTEIYPTTVETSTNDYMSSSTTEGVTPPDRCSEGMLGNIPHEYRCDYFYVCAAGSAIPLHCSDGFEFDPVTRTCVVIAPGGCTLGDGTEIYPTTVETTTNDYMSSSTTEGVTPPDRCTEGMWGNIPHEYRCDYFYVCAAGSAIPLHCSDGFEFDPVTKTCVVIAPGGCTLGDGTEIYPTTVETSTNDYMSSSTTEGVTPPDRCTEGMWGNIPHEYRCDYFYVCAAGNAIPLHCSDGFEFDPVTRECVLIAEGGCTYNTTTTTPEPTTLGPVSSLCPPGTWGNVPHPEICNSFYMCAGTPIQLFCREGFEFDPVTGVCVLIAEGGCTYNTTMTTPEPTTLDPMSSLCPPGTWGNVPHPEICNLFYMCAGTPIQLFCREGFEFDPVTRECVLIAEGGCTYNTTTLTPEPTTLGPISSLCPPGTWGNVPHPEICNSFYMCAGTPIQLFCREGFEFDPVTRECVLIAEGGCTYNTTTTTPEPTTLGPVSSLCPPGTWGNVPHPEICNSFYMCAGTPIQLFCREGFEFDPVTRECVLIAEGGCTYNTTTTTPDPTTLGPVSSLCPPGTWGNVPHPEICNSFYMCAGTPIQLFCREGFEFDPVTRVCILIAKGGCTYNTTTTTPETTTLDPVSSLCPPGTWGNVPHPEICNSFYMCAGTPTQLFCRESFEFEPVTGLCVAIAEGGCTYNQGTTTGNVMEKQQQYQQLRIRFLKRITNR